MKQERETKLVYIEEDGQRDVGFYRWGRFELPADWSEEKVREMAHTLLDQAAVDWRIAEKVEPSSVDHVTVDEVDRLSVEEGKGSLDPEDESPIHLVSTNGDEIEIL